MQHLADVLAELSGAASTTDAVAAAAAAAAAARDTTGGMAGGTAAGTMTTGTAAAVGAAVATASLPDGHPLPSSHHLVLDLGGKLFQGPLQGQPPHQLRLSRPNTTIRNGGLMLSDDTRLLVDATDCRLERIAILVKSSSSTGVGGSCQRAGCGRAVGWVRAGCWLGAGWVRATCGLGVG
jgi:hypothetical protein